MGGMGSTQAENLAYPSSARSAGEGGPPEAVGGVSPTLDGCGSPLHPSVAKINGISFQIGE